MILKDDLAQYIPIKWTLVHPTLYSIVLVAVARKLAEIAVNEYMKGEYKIYWQRNLDDPKLELGL